MQKQCEIWDSVCAALYSVKWNLTSGPRLKWGIFRRAMPVVGKQDIIECYHTLNSYSKAEVSCLQFTL